MEAITASGITTPFIHWVRSPKPQFTPPGRRERERGGPEAETFPPPLPLTPPTPPHPTTTTAEEQLATAAVETEIINAGPGKRPSGGPR